MHAKKNLGATRRVNSFVAECALLGLGTFALLMCIFAVNGYAPFGPLSLATIDANYQYLDFFSYLKDILAGKAHVTYSFSKVLGGNCTGILAYYLASPVNILVLFFEKPQLTTFFDIAVAIKLSLAAVTFRIFLQGRFEVERNNRIVACLLALAYGLGQYGLAQASNIMWLDGLYLLPLIMLGTTRVVRGEHATLLSLSVGASVLFNWYTGGINCLFSIMWLIAELLLTWASGQRKYSAKDVLLLGLRYGAAMIIGLLLSCILFLPTLKAMGTGGNSELEFSLLTDFSIVANPLSTLTRMSIGSVSNHGDASLWCGSVALAGCMLALLDTRISRKVRIVRWIIVLVYVGIFYLSVTDALFSLLKTVESYWYRYSYGSIAAIVAIAGEFLLCNENIESLRKRRVAYIACAAVLAVLMFVGATIVHEKGGTTPVTIALSSLLLVVMLVLILLWMQGARSRLVLSSLAALSVAEMALGTTVLFGHYSIANVEYSAAYTEGAKREVAALIAYDDSDYRIVENSTRITAGRPRATFRADYNESLAYGYMSNAGYTSAPDDTALDFLDGIGYVRRNSRKCTTNDSLLAADSLLGVKYVLSEYPVAEMSEVQNLAQENGRRTYANPYALPLALTYEPGFGVDPYEGNSFTHLNAVWSELLGRDAELFHEVSATRQEGEADGLPTLSYSGSAPTGDVLLYGNIPWEEDEDTPLMLNVNDAYETGYMNWNSPSVFVIPVGEGQDTFTVSCAATDGQNLSQFGEGQFYALDLNALAAASDEISDRAAQIITWEDGHVVAQAKGTANTSMLLSIPSEDGWEVKVNGTPVEPERLDNALISVPLSEGDNEVELTYHAAGWTLGICCTIAGIVGLVLQRWLENRMAANEPKAKRPRHLAAA